MLIYSRSLVSLDVIPNFSNDDNGDPIFDPNNPDISINFDKMQKCNSKLTELYHHEFLLELMSQSVSKRDKYRPVRHKLLSVGDIVLLVEPHLKQYNYPMGIIKSVNINTLGEVTSATVFKGKTRETVFRHSTSLILLLSPDDKTEGSDCDQIPNQADSRAIISVMLNFVTL